MTPLHELLTTEEAAERVGLSASSLAQYRVHPDRGGPPYVRIGRSVRYRTEDLTAWLASRIVEVKAA